MVEPLGPRKMTSNDEIAVSSMYEPEALLEFLVEKGIITKEGLF